MISLLLFIPMSILGTHTFNYNGFNGNSNMNSYKYKLTFWKKIQLILGL